MNTSRTSKATIRVLLGTALGILPLKEMFTDSGWLIDCWLTMAIVILPAAALRSKFRPASWQLLPGFAAAALFLTARFLPAHATLGFIPSLATSSDLGRMSDLVHSAMSEQAAPIHTTPAIRLYLAAGLALLAAVIDIVAICLRAPAVTGIAFLLAGTLSGAVTRHAVGWVLIAGAALGYLLVLSSGAGMELSKWGRRAPDPTGHSALGSRAGESGRRIAVISLIISLVLASIVPIPSGNILADALHHNGNADDGKGTGTRVYLDPLATLKGQLTRSTPVELFDVTVSNAQGSEPFYLRQDILETYTGAAWVQGNNRIGTRSIQPGQLGGVPPLHPENAPQDTFTASIHVRGLGGTPPLFYLPQNLNGSKDWQWDAGRQLVVGQVGRDQTYVEQVQQPKPTADQLNAADPDPKLTTDLLRDLQLPKNTPAEVSNLVLGLTSSAESPYARALAIFNFFADPASNFVYSLTTKAGDSGNDLVDFLKARQGYCQQYAAAMGVMLRLANVPSRVVLGYTHRAPDKNGNFVVTSNDAHAWVEAYFSGIGWVPFDPTPLAGNDAARAVALPWAARNTGGGSSGSADSRDPSILGDSTASTGETTASTASSSSTGSGGGSWWAPIAGIVVLVVLMLVSVPAAIRWLRRRRRFTAARLGRPLALWVELQDTCLDLGIGWSPARSPRQVVVWLREFGLDRAGVAALEAVADAIELHSYGPRLGVDELTGEDLVASVQTVRHELVSSADRSARWRMRLWPISLWRRSTQPAATGTVARR
jgi:transglutaminase-like putative cysteine protease